MDSLDKDVGALHKTERRLINILRQTFFGEINIIMVKGLPEFVVRVSEKIKLSD